MGCLYDDMFVSGLNAVWGHLEGKADAVSHGDRAHALLASQGYILEGICALESELFGLCQDYADFRVVLAFLNRESESILHQKSK